MIAIRLEDLEDTAASKIRLSEEIDLLRLEANTWGLLQAVLPFVFVFLSCSVANAGRQLAQLELGKQSHLLR
jgi:hypothetical protein